MIRTLSARTLVFRFGLNIIAKIRSFSLQPLVPPKQHSHHSFYLLDGMPHPHVVIAIHGTFFGIASHCERPTHANMQPIENQITKVVP